MATAQLLPIYSRISQKFLRKTAHRRMFGALQTVEGFDLFILTLSCPLHAWSWPRANREDRISGYDAHQTCHKCTSHRMFDTRSWKAGPIYRRIREKYAVDPQTAEFEGRSIVQFPKQDHVRGKREIAPSGKQNLLNWCDRG